MTPTIAVHHTADGDIHYLVPPDATLLIIDERLTIDRVYRHSTTSTADEIVTLVGDSPICNADVSNEFSSAHATAAALWKACGHAISLIPGPVEDE